MPGTYDRMIVVRQAADAARAARVAAVTDEQIEAARHMTWGQVAWQAGKGALLGGLVGYFWGEPNGKNTGAGVAVGAVASVVGASAIRRGLASLMEAARAHARATTSR